MPVPKGLIWKSGKGVFLHYGQENTYVSILKEDHRHLIPNFKSDNNELNDFLLKDALGYQSLHFGITYLLFSKSDNKLLAFITLSMGTIRLSDERLDFIAGGRRLEEYPKNFPNQFPALLIGRLATDTSEQNKGAASLLLDFAVKMALDEREKIGCVCLAAHAYNDKKVIDWYLKKRFKLCLGVKKELDTVPMYFELG